MKNILLLFSFFCFQIAFAQGVSQDVQIQTDETIIKGTFLKPDETGVFPTALIISGSGPTDRNGNNPAMKNNSLKMLAESLAENGIASLRYDKRGVAASADSTIHESELTFEDFIHDAEHWVEFLHARTDVDSVTIIGHSEGSLIGMIAAQKGNVQKFVSLAGAGMPADSIILQQINKQSPVMARYSAVIIDSLLAGKTVRQMPEPLEALFRVSVQPYLRSWFKYNPQTEISKLKIPVLIVQGKTDIQVDTKQAELLKNASPGARLILIPGMNHVLKTAPMEKQANLATYTDPTYPINSMLIDTIVSFMKGE